MGSQQPKVNTKTNTIIHPRFGEVELSVCSKTNLILMQFQIIAQAREYQQWACRQPKEDCTNDLIFIATSHSYVQKGFCGYLGAVKIQFEHFPCTLLNQIQKRMSEDLYFYQEQVWNIAYKMAMAITQHENVNSRVIDLRPINLLLSNDGFVKVITNLSLPNWQNPLAQFYQGKSIIYLSPEQLSHVQKKQFHPNVNYCLAQSFSLGILLLQISLLRDIQDIYDSANFKINQKRLESYLSQLRGSARFTPFFCFVVESLVQKESCNRTIAGQLYAFLLPYQNQILNLQNFTVIKQSSHRELRKYEERQKELDYMREHWAHRDRRFGLKHLGSKPGSFSL